MRISDWSSDVCSSDLDRVPPCSFLHRSNRPICSVRDHASADRPLLLQRNSMSSALALTLRRSLFPALNESISEPTGRRHDRHSFHSHADPRSEEHTSELQSLMRISYAVFCLKKKKYTTLNNN